MNTGATTGQAAQPAGNANAGLAQTPQAASTGATSNTASAPQAVAPITGASARKRAALRNSQPQLTNDDQEEEVDLIDSDN